MEIHLALSFSTSIPIPIASESRDRQRRFIQEKLGRLLGHCPQNRLNSGRYENSPNSQKARTEKHNRFHLESGKYWYPMHSLQSKSYWRSRWTHEHPLFKLRLNTFFNIGTKRPYHKHLKKKKDQFVQNWIALPQHFRTRSLKIYLGLLKGRLKMDAFHNGRHDLLAFSRHLGRILILSDHLYNIKLRC